MSIFRVKNIFCISGNISKTSRWNKLIRILKQGYKCSHFKSNFIQTCLSYLKNIHYQIALSAGAIEYTDCFSADGQDPLNECPGYNSKQSDDEALLMLELWGMQSTLSFPSLPDPL